MTCKPYDVGVVPFPFSDRHAAKRRPAVALSSEAFSTDNRHTVLAMITSVKNPPWSFDVPINAVPAGLHSPSKVRMKLFTLDNHLILRAVGSLDEPDRRRVAAALGRLLAL